jgi:hypothetical protein
LERDKNEIGEIEREGDKKLERDRREIGEGEREKDKNWRETGVR